MSSMQRKTTGERRLKTPTWAVNDKELQHLLVVFMEERAGFIKKNKPLVENKEDLTPEGLKARLKKATEKVQSRRAGQLVVMKRLNEEYVSRRFLQGSDASDRLRELEIEIQGLNTSLRISENGTADVVAAIVYMYYRTGMDSVGVGSELGIKPPHVRQTLWRLHRTADRIAGIKRPVVSKEEREARKLARAETLRLEAEDRAARAVERAELARTRAIELIAAAQRREEKTQLRREVEGESWRGLPKQRRTRVMDEVPPAPVPVMLKGNMPRWMLPVLEAV